MLFKNFFGGGPAAAVGLSELENMEKEPDTGREGLLRNSKSFALNTFPVSPQGRFGAAAVDQRQSLGAGATAPVQPVVILLYGRFLRVLLLLIPLAVACACQTLGPHLSPANLQEPGWTVHQGQAVWHLPKGGREIAGDVLLATRQDGESFVQFSKTPFTLVTAQSNAQGWRAEFPPQNKHYSGRGAPPKRLLWLYLPRALSGKSLPKGFSWRQDANGWRLENKASGESLEGYFTQ